MSVRKIISPIYKVKKGDTLKSISEKFNINPTQILISNGITPRQIEEGFVIFLDL